MATSRKQQFKKIAYDLDMNFHERDEWDMIMLLRDFQLFRKGRRKLMSPVIEKTHPIHDIRLSIFDYSYVVGKQKRMIKQTVFFVQSKRLGLPQFLMKPEHIFHHLGEQIGIVQDINFEQYPDYSKHYLLQGEDEYYIRHTLHDDFLKFFSVNKNWYVEGLNFYLVIYKYNTVFTTSSIKHFYKMGLDIANMLSQEEF